MYRHSVCISQKTLLSSIRKTSALVCACFHLAYKRQPDTLVRFYYTFERLLSLRWFSCLQSSTVEPPRNSANETKLTQCRVCNFYGKCDCLLQETVSVYCKKLCLFIARNYVCLLKETVSVYFKKLCLFIVRNCVCLLQETVSVYCKKLRLFIERNCVCLLQETVSIYCKKLCLFFARNCLFIARNCVYLLQETVSVYCKKLCLYIARNCVCLLQETMSVYCKNDRNT